jgi:hypothetical protein
MADITVTARITTIHPIYGPVIQGETYTIAEEDFGGDVFSSATPMGIEPTPAGYLTMKANPTAVYTPLYIGDGSYPGNGIHVGGARCNGRTQPENSYPFHIGNIFYVGQGIYPGGGL